MPVVEAIRDWYNDTAPASAPVQATVTWDDVFTCWTALSLDFHSRFRADFGDGILDRRTWRWFTDRVADLLDDKDSRLALAVRPLVMLRKEAKPVD